MPVSGVCGAGGASEWGEGLLLLGAAAGCCCCCSALSGHECREVPPERSPRGGYLVRLPGVSRPSWGSFSRAFHSTFHELISRVGVMCGGITRVPMVNDVGLWLLVCWRGCGMVTLTHGPEPHTRAHTHRIHGPHTGTTPHTGGHTQTDKLRDGGAVTEPGTGPRSGPRRQLGPPRTEPLADAVRDRVF